MSSTSLNVRLISDDEVEYISGGDPGGTLTAGYYGTSSGSASFYGGGFDGGSNIGPGVTVTATTQDYVRAWADGWSDSFHTGAVLFGGIAAVSAVVGAAPVAASAGATAGVAEVLSLASGAVASYLSANASIP